MIKNPRAIFIFLFFQQLVFGTAVQSFGSLIPVISGDLKTEFVMLGISLSVYSFSVFIASILGGNIAEMIGIRIVLIIGNILSTISLIGIFFTQNLALFILFHFMFGFAQGITLVNVTSLIGKSFSIDKSKRILILNSGFVGGHIFANLLVSLNQYLDMTWRNIFLLISFLSLSLLVLIFFLRLHSEEKGLHKKQSFKEVLASNIEIIKNPYFMLCALIIFLFNGTMSSFQNWFTTYFKMMDVSINISPLLLNLYYLFVILGFLSKNYLLKILKEEKILLINVFTGLPSLLCFFLIDNMILKVIFLCLFAITITGILEIILSLSLDLKKGSEGTAMSLLFSSLFIGLIVFNYLTGWVLDRFSTTGLYYLDVASISMLTAVVVIFYIYSKRKIIRKNN